MLSISEANKRLVRTSIFLTLIGFTLGCNSTRTPLATITVTPHVTSEPLQSPPSATMPTSPNEIVQVCPDRYPSEERIPLNGKLLYWDYPSLYALSFPDLVKSEITNAKSSYVSVSPNNNYFVTLNEVYDEQKTSSSLYLDVIDFNGEVISSTLWKEDWGEGSPIWRNDEEILIKTMQEKTLLVYNPFSGAIYNKIFNFPDEENMRLVAFDPLFRVVVYMYSSYGSASGIGQWDRLCVWDEENQREILNFKDEFSAMVSSVILSNQKNKIAITTVTPNESEDHSEIILVDSENGTYTQISDFRSYFDEILISDIQWSLDDKTIYFWAIVNGGDNELFSINLQTKQITHYCFRGRFGAEILIAWMPNAPGFYFVSDSTSLANYSTSSKDEWDILLVDSVNNKTYKVAENVSLIGWLTQIK